MCHPKPDKLPAPCKVDSVMKRVILMSMCLIFGMEIGFKCATNQLIFILNPCHLITMTQVTTFLEFAPPGVYMELLKFGNLGKIDAIRIS